AMEPAAVDLQRDTELGIPLVELDIQAMTLARDDQPSPLGPPPPPPRQLRERHAPDQGLVRDRPREDPQDLGHPAESAFGMSVGDGQLPRVEPGCDQLAE